MGIFNQLLIFITSIVLGTACVTSSADVDYSEHNLYSSDQTGNREYREIGKVSTGQTTVAWKACSEVAKDAIKNLTNQAKRKGGNAIVEVRFKAGDKWVDEPVCNQNWAFLIQSIEVKGKAVKVVGH